MLRVATDLEESAWLVYILEEFRRISQAQFEIKVESLQESHSDPGSQVLFYTSSPQTGLTIGNRSNRCVNFELQWLDERIFAVKDSVCSSQEFIAGYDIFWNAFIFLSRYEEFLAEDSGHFINSYSSRHPRKDTETFLVPIVNRIFQDLEGLISKQFPDLLFGAGDGPKIDLSHDLDYIDKTIQLRLKQTAMNTWKTLGSVMNPSSFGQNMTQTARFLFSSPSYWCFDYWSQLETEYQFKSTFYVYSQNRRRGGMKKWLLDPSYDISTNTKLQNELKELRQQGFQIGLHGSFESALDLGILKEEKELLENAVEFPVTKTRQHWLRYREKITPAIHEELFEVDSTLGWNDQIGFRAGCCSAYRPYDHTNQRAFNFLEIPQAIMDSTIFDYGHQHRMGWQKKSILLLEELKGYKNAQIAISWHPRVCSADYNWHLFYEETLKTISSLRAGTESQPA